MSASTTSTDKGAEPRPKVSLSQQEGKQQCTTMAIITGFGGYLSATCYMSMMFFALSTAINCVVRDESLDDPVDQCVPHEDSQNKYSNVITIQRAVTFVFGKFLGDLSDQVGRKPLMCGALLGYGLTAVCMFWGATSLEYAPFVIGGIVLGVSAPFMPHGLAAIADISPEKDLGRNIGILQGLGTQLGLLTGAIVALVVIVVKENYGDDNNIDNVETNFSVVETSFVVSMILGATGIVALTLFFKETLHKDEKQKLNWAEANPLHGLWIVCRTKYMFCAGLLVFLMSFGLAASEATFLNWVVTRFSLYKWARSDTFCPKTLSELMTTLKFNVSDSDVAGSGFRCCSWDATLHGHEWSPADWGSPGATYLPAGSANGPLNGAADRGSFLSPTMLKPNGETCMEVPGVYTSCAGWNEAVAAATASGVAIYSAEAANQSSAMFIAAYTAAGGNATLTAADLTNVRVPTAVGAYVMANVGAEFAARWTLLGSLCGDPAKADDEVCPGLGFPACVPDGIHLSKVMQFIVPLFVMSGFGQAIVMTALPKAIGIKRASLFLMIWSAVSATVIAFFETYAMLWIYVFLNAVGAATQSCVVTLFIGQAHPSEKGAVAGSYRTIEAGGKALGSFIMGTLYMSAYFSDYPAQGLKWDEFGVANYDADGVAGYQAPNPVGGTLLKQGTICQPASPNVGAMNPYKTQAAATAIAMPFATPPVGEFYVAAAATGSSPTGANFVAGATAYATAGGTMTYAGNGTDYVTAITPYITVAVTADITARVTANVTAMINGCKPTNVGGVATNSDDPWCKYDYLPGDKDGADCALAKTYDMFEDPPWPGIVLIYTSIPLYLMVLLFIAMESIPAIKSTCLIDQQQAAEKNTGVGAPMPAVEAQNAP